MDPRPVGEQRQTSSDSRRRPAFGTLLGIALLVGFTLAWVDSRPQWDDTGMLVVMILFVSGALSFIRPQDMWIWILTTTLWIPALSICQGRGYASLMAVVVGFAGGLIGSSVRGLFRRT